MKWNRPIIVAIGLAFLAVVCLLHIGYAHTFPFLIFYLGPVIFMIRFGGSRDGFIFSLLSATVWLLVSFLTHKISPPPPWTAYWNVIESAMFLTVALLFVFLNRIIVLERRWAREDPLTGLANRRSFFEVAERELQRARRYQRPITMAYVDIDDFKKTNDALGHGEGDELLREVGVTLRANLRAVDLSARVGGDEFAVLLPDINAESAQTVIEKLHEKLTSVMDQSGKWPVTFSVGGVTFEKPPASVQDMLLEADRRMYFAKSAGKNACSFKVVHA